MVANEVQTGKDEKTLYSWVAPTRPFKRRGREFYITIISIAAIVGLVVFLVEGAMPVVLLASLIFLFYIMNTTEPEKTEYRITNLGVRVGTNLTVWNNLQRYWFTKKSDSNVLVIDSLGFPGRLEFVINESDVDQIKEVLKDKLKEENMNPTAMDKAVKWVSDKLPQS